MFALTTPEMTGGAPVEDWISRAGERRRVVGAIVSRQVARLTWYPNPPNSPQPGLYVEDVYVRPEFRRRGIGLSLFRHLAGIAVQRHCFSLACASQLQY